MNTDIRFIFFDLGGTFRVIKEDPSYLAAAKTKIAELCGVQVEDPCAWFDTVIDKRYDKYREWALRFMCEAPEEVLWTRWLAYDCDRDLILKKRRRTDLPVPADQGHPHRGGRRRRDRQGAVRQRGIPWASSPTWLAAGRWTSGWTLTACGPISRPCSNPPSPMSVNRVPPSTITPWRM